ncbi:MAG TPA: hypothetical protein VHB20_11040 [Verrucomicrobiae bacterium]|jgi:hypothetical protein|nr:hypothetical protein [Verrucomicrobiae bacterium]
MNSSIVQTAWLCLICVASGWAAPGVPPPLFWHDVRLDSEGKLLSWIESDSPYDAVVRRGWNMFERIPVQPDGFRTYIDYPTFRGPNDPEGPPFSGKIWAHNPAGLFAMLTDGAILYHAYSGDRIVLERVREMLDHMLAHGTTDGTAAYAWSPYASGDAGNPIFHGGTDTIYCDQESHSPCGRGDGVGFLEPDKIGELGFAYLQFYEVTLEKKYLRAAERCADALAANAQPGDESHSPWPFRVDAKTGKIVREQYSANVIGPIRLFDELLRLKAGQIESYAQARAWAWQWLMRYPMENMVWTQYFEDVLIYADYRVNRNQYSALETARYLLQHPELDPQARAHAKRLIDWAASSFARDSKTMGGLREKGNQWGAEVMSEQINDMDKMSSHTARFASVLALWAEVAGDPAAKARAFRSFNWASYSENQDGLVKTSLDEGTGYWFSDGYGDYMRHFQRGMASVPEWAPAHEAHLLGSTSIVRRVNYGEHELKYETFDRAARETLRLPEAPISVRAGFTTLPKVASLDGVAEGYSVTAIAKGGVVVRVKHRGSRRIVIKCP